MRTNSRPRAAGDRLADRGLAGAGRPDQGQDRAVGAAVLLDLFALLAQLAHGDELGDPFLHVLEPGVVGVEHLTRVDGSSSLLGALAPRHRDQPVEVAADHRALGRLLALALESAQLLVGLLVDRLRHAGLVDLASRTRRSDRSRPRPAPCGSTPSVCAGSTRAAVSGRPTRRRRGSCERTCSSASRSRWSSTAISSRSVTSIVSSRRSLPSLGMSGARPEVSASAPGSSIERRKARCDRRRRAARGSPRPRRGTHAPARGCARRRDGRRGSPGPRRAGCRRRSVGLGGTGDAAVQADHGRDRDAAARAAVLDHLGDDADAAELAITARDQEDALVLADVDRQGRGDGREDDRVV